MAKRTRTLAERLQEISAELAVISQRVAKKTSLSSLTADEPEPTEAAKSLAAAGKCVQCGDSIPAGKRNTFGLDAKCYKKTRDKYGNNRWNELIAAGLAMPRRSGGRPTKKTRLDEFDAKLKERAAGVDDARASFAKKKKEQ